MRAWTGWVCGALLMGAVGLLTAEDHPKGEGKPANPPAAKSHPGFEALKALAGTWTGVFGEDGGTGPCTITYKVTSSGSAVLETMFPGEPHEMVTLYHLDGEELVMTHYCAVGNRPFMKAAPLQQEAGKPPVLKFTQVADGKNDQGPHMHDAEFVFTDADRLGASWSRYVDDKQVSVVKFTLTRKK